MFVCKDLLRTKIRLRGVSYHPTYHSSFECMFTVYALGIRHGFLEKKVYFP